jgi:hypothetical protein
METAFGSNNAQLVQSKPLGSKYRTEKTPIRVIADLAVPVMGPTRQNRLQPLRSTTKPAGHANGTPRGRRRALRSPNGSSSSRP